MHFSPGRQADGPRFWTHLAPGGLALIFMLFMSSRAANPRPQRRERVTSKTTEDAGFHSLEKACEP
jgi:hypothetical protein